MPAPKNRPVVIASTSYIYIIHIKHIIIYKISFLCVREYKSKMSVRVHMPWSTCGDWRPEEFVGLDHSFTEILLVHLR